MHEGAGHLRPEVVRPIKSMAWLSLRAMMRILRWPKRHWTGRSTIKRAIAVTAAFVALLCLWGFTRLGIWIVVQDPLEKADTIVVLGGELPYRAMEAARLHTQGWAREIWVTQTESVHLRDTRLLVPELLPEHEYSYKVLRALGVPENSIRILEPPVIATVDEVKVIVSNLQQTRGKRAILVTSKYHTRRLRVTWNAVADDHYEAVVRYTDRTPFDRDHWWRNSRDVLAVSREMGGILNAWAGFPLYE
jgi:uncharacterized SAM-binding protein YcdF (DUF218 family)